MPTNKTTAARPALPANADGLVEIGYVGGLVDGVELVLPGRKILHCPHGHAVRVPAEVAETLRDLTDWNTDALDVADEAAQTTETKP